LQVTAPPALALFHVEVARSDYTSFVCLCVCVCVCARARARVCVCTFFQLNDIYVCCYVASCILMKIKFHHLIKCSNTRPLLSIHSWIRYWKLSQQDRRTFLEIFRQAMQSYFSLVVGVSAYTVFFKIP